MEMQNAEGVVVKKESEYRFDGFIELRSVNGACKTKLFSIAFQTWKIFGTIFLMTLSMAKMLKTKTTFRSSKKSGLNS